MNDDRGVHVQLRKGDRQELSGMVARGRESVRTVARRYAEGGLESALYEKSRPGKQRTLNAGQSQRIVAMVCGPPPAGGRGGRCG